MTASLRPLIMSTLADMQHEVQAAGDNARQRQRVRVLGLIALAKVLTVFLILGGGAMRRWVVTVLLACCGSGLLFSTVGKSQTKGAVDMFWFAVFALVTPLVLRGFRLGRSYADMFWSCVTVGLTMLTTSYVLVCLDPHSAALRSPIQGHLWRLALFGAMAVVASAMAARAAWREPRSSRSLAADTSKALLAAWCTMTAVFWVVRAIRFGQAQWFQISFMSAWVSFCYVALSVICLVPILALLRSRGAHRFVLAAVGILLSPGLWIALYYFIGLGRVEVNALWQQVLAGTVFWTLTPSVAAGAVLGWFMAGRPLAGPARSSPGVRGENGTLVKECS